MTKSVFTLKRNDIEAAVEFAKLAMKAGKYGPWVAQALARLQDDPSELIDRLEKLLEGANGR